MYYLLFISPFLRYCNEIKDETRRTKCGMIAVLDEGVNNVTKALKDTGLYDDTLIFFTTGTCLKRIFITSAYTCCARSVHQRLRYAFVLRCNESN